MGTVYLGQQRGAAGFQRLVAVKRAHPHLLEDESAVKMLVTEARLASLVRHPNVVGVTDVEEEAGELLLVMEYVEGASLSEVNADTGPMSLGIAMRIILDACEGLDALHRAEDEDGAPLGIVHRDVSPQNVLVGVDGLARLADFGIARACALEGTTTVIRGKPSYMSPEYTMTARATPASDVFALGVVAWETLTHQRLFKGINDIDIVERVRKTDAHPPSRVRPEIPRELDAIILKAVARDPTERFRTAREFADALNDAARKSTRGPNGRSIWVASRNEVGAFVAQAFDEKLRARREALRHQTISERADAPMLSHGDMTPRPVTTDAAIAGRATQIMRSAVFGAGALATLAILGLTATNAARDVFGEGRANRHRRAVAAQVQDRGPESITTVTNGNARGSPPPGTYPPTESSAPIAVPAVAPPPSTLPALPASISSPRPESPPGNGPERVDPPRPQATPAIAESAHPAESAPPNERFPKPPTFRPANNGHSPASEQDASSARAPANADSRAPIVVTPPAAAPENPY